MITELISTSNRRINFLHDFGLVPESRVFVPLCGKNLDMVWLAKQGHDVIGVALSPIAVRAFFRENRLLPARRQLGKFTLWQQCGDYFSLTLEDLGRIDTVYDRAALTALSEDIRKHYVSHLRKIIPATATVFLLTTEEADENETDTDSQAFGVSVDRTEYKVYRLAAKAGSE